MKDIRTWLLLAAIAVILFLALCRKPKTVVIDNIVPTEQLQNNVKVDSTAIQKVIDSANTEIGYSELKLNQSEAERSRLSAVVNNLNDQIYDMMNDSPTTIPDDLTKRINELSKANAKKDTLCNKSISSLRLQLSAKDKIVSEKNNLYKKLKLNFDTCLNNQRLVEKQFKDNKPRNQLLLGVTMIGSQYDIFAGYGITADFKFKNGTMIGAAAIQMNSSTYGQIKISKVISFRK